MANTTYNTYIGARYVPKFDGEWDNTKKYEPLIIVSHQGNSYTSKTYVPIGAEINDKQYWALTGNYNAQVESYRQEVATLQSTYNSILPRLTNWINVVELGADNTGITPIDSIVNNITSNGVLYFPKGTYKILNQISLNGLSLYGDSARIIKPTLDDATFSESAFEISGNNIFVTGFTFYTMCKPLYLKNITNGNIGNCTFGVSEADNHNNYALTLYNTSYTYIHDIIINQPTNPNISTNGNDGIHIYGGCHDITIERVSGVSGDDFIALNCPEPTGNDGDIYNITIRDVVTSLNNVRSVRGIRLYCNTSKIYNVTIDNCKLSTSSATSRPIFITNDAGQIGIDTKPKASVSNLRILNTSFESASQGLLLGRVKIKNIILKNCTYTTNDQFIIAYASNITDITLDNLSGTYGVNFFLDDNATTTDTLNFNNVSTQNNFLYIRGTLNTLNITDSIITNLLINPVSNIGSINVSNSTFNVTSNISPFTLNSAISSIRLIGNTFNNVKYIIELQASGSINTINISSNTYISAHVDNVFLNGKTIGRAIGEVILLNSTPSVSSSKPGDTFYLYNVTTIIPKLFTNDWTSIQLN